MSFSLVGGIGWNGEFSPSILIRVSSASTNAMRAWFLVERIPWRCPFRCPFAVLVESGNRRRTVVVVRPGHVERLPAWTAAMSVSFGGNPNAACCQSSVWRELGRSNTALSASCGVVGVPLTVVSNCLLGSNCIFHSPVSSHRGAVRTGGWVVVSHVVDLCLVFIKYSDVVCICQFWYTDEGGM